MTIIQNLQSRLTKLIYAGDNQRRHYAVNACIRYRRILLKFSRGTTKENDHVKIAFDPQHNFVVTWSHFLVEATNSFREPLRCFQRNHYIHMHILLYYYMFVMFDLLSSSFFEKCNNCVIKMLKCFTFCL